LVVVGCCCCFVRGFVLVGCALLFGVVGGGGVWLVWCVLLRVRCCLVLLVVGCFVLDFLSSSSSQFFPLPVGRLDYGYLRPLDIVDGLVDDDDD
jgi:hypothetical protein